MQNIDWIPKKKNDKFGTLISLSLLAIFFICKAIIESGHLLFYVTSLIIGITAYFLLEFIQKKRIAKPASLGEFKKKYPIIIQYAPPKGISPAEAGLLYNCSVEPTDLTSLIYQRKFENLIDIKTFTGENSNKEYVKLIKKADIPLTRPLFESEIFDSIFSMGDIKIIEGAFQLRYALMLEDLEFHGIQKGWVKFKEKRDNKEKITYFYKNKIGIKSILIFIYIAISIISIIMEMLGISNDIFANISVSFTELLRFGAIILGIIIGIILLLGIMDGGGKLRFTDKGAKLASQVIGYSNFIKSCDENKIKLLLKEDPLFIDRTLPYATAFGMETEFLKKISPLKNDWNAKYVRGEKVPDLSIIRYLLGGNDDSLL